MLKVLAKATEQSAQEQRVAERRGGSQQIPVCIQPNVEIFGPVCCPKEERVLRAPWSRVIAHGGSL